MALAKIGLEAILEMTNFNRGLAQYQRGIGQAEKETGKAGRAFTEIGKALGGLGVVAGGATAGIAAVKRVMDFGAEGAAIAQTRASFDGLMASMGQGPGILDAMREASRGTIDDMTLMSSTMTLLAGTSDALGGAIVQASPQLLEIAKAANKLNPTLGDTAFLYQSLATGIKRSSPLILDNLGLTIKVGEANEEYARQIGKTVEELTAEDKQMALLTATLKAGDRMIQQVGGSTEAMGDEFAQATVKIKNATDAIKADFAPALADALGIIAEKGPEVADTANQIILLADAGMAWVGAALSGEDATQAFERALTGLSVADRQAIASANALTQAYGTTEARFVGMFDAAQDYGGSVGTVSEGNRTLADAFGTVAGKIDNARAALVEMIPEFDTAAMAEAKAAIAAQDFGAAMDALHYAMAGELGQAVVDLQANISALDAELAGGAINAQEYKSQLDALTQSFQDNIDQMAYAIAEAQILDALQSGLIEDTNQSGTAYDEAMAILTTLAEQMGLIDEDTAAFREAITGLTDALIAGAYAPEEYAAAMAGMTDAATEAAAAGESVAEAVKGIPDSQDIEITNNMDETVGAANELTEALNAIPTDIVISVVMDTSGMTIPGYQHGGPVGAYSPIVVGEAGPELFVPHTSGTILPNTVLGNLSIPSMMPMGGTNTTAHNAYGGDTIILNIHNREAMGMAQRWVGDRQRARLNRGM